MTVARIVNEVSLGYRALPDPRTMRGHSVHGIMER